MKHRLEEVRDFVGLVNLLAWGLASDDNVPDEQKPGFSRLYRLAEDAAEHLGRRTKDALIKYGPAGDKAWFAPAPHLKPERLERINEGAQPKKESNAAQK